MKTQVKERDILIGSDIECGLWRTRESTIIPATDFNTPFTSESRGTIPKLGTFHRDNITLEFQTTPASHPEDMAKNVRGILKWLDQKYQEKYSTVMYISPAIEYKDKAMVQTREAAEMGCEPDFCAYSKGKKMHAPSPSGMGPFRYASGHIHIGGVADMKPEQIHRLVRWVDILAAVPISVRYELDGPGIFEQVFRRREFYGQAGRFRPKPYGVECRVFSSAWVKPVHTGSNNPTTILFNAIKTAIDLTDLGLRPEDYFDMAQVRGVLQKPKVVKKADHFSGYTDLDQMDDEMNKVAGKLVKEHNLENPY